MFMREKRSHPLVTYFLLIINVVIYIYLAWQSNNPFEIERIWMERYGFMKESFLRGRYWQVLTNMFVHFDFPHLGYNMVFLTFFGSKSEEVFGRARTFYFYLLFGAVTTLVAFIYPLGTVSAGASGAIFGLLGADLIANRGVYPSGIWTSLLYGAVFFFFAAATGFLAHLVGLIVGFVAGYWTTRDWYVEEEEEKVAEAEEIKV
jgi:rhomboid protease GluP